MKINKKNFFLKNLKKSKKKKLKHWMAPTTIKIFSEKSKKIAQEKRVTETLAGVIKKKEEKKNFCAQNPCRSNKS